LAGTAIAPILGDQDLILTVTAFAAMLLGIMMMAVRRDFYSQIVGFLTLENGIAIFVIASLGVLPLTIEILTFVVIGVTALLMSLLARRFKELYAVEEFMTYGEVID
jgi:hydrogenase-4 component E